MLNVVLAMAGIYLLLSLVASGINERIAAALGERGWNLKLAVTRLLGPVLAERFYRHGQVSALQEEPWFVERVLRATGGWVTTPHLRMLRDGLIGLAQRVGSKPSYVRGSTFASVVLELLRDTSPGASAVAVARGGFASTGNREQDVAGAGLQSVLTAGLRAAAQAGASTEAEILPHLEAALATHFDATMERVTGWYRRRTQIWLCLIAFVLTMGLNVDSLKLAGALWADPALSSEFAERVSTFAKPPSSDKGSTADPAPGGGPSTTAPASGVGASLPPTKPPTASEAWELLRKARLDTLPIGWEQCDVPTHAAFGLLSVRVVDEDSHCPGDEERAKCASADPPFGGASCRKYTWAGYAGSHLIGWLITVFAVAAGAPFWFDIIARITSLRGSGGAPAPVATTSGEAPSAPAAPGAPGGAPAGLLAPTHAGLPAALRPIASRRRALLAAEAAELAYVTEAPARAAHTRALGLALIGHAEDAATGTFALLARAADNTLVVAFRGTEPTKLKDWKTDFDAGFQPARDGGEGREHAGFAVALAAVLPRLEQLRAEGGGNGPVLVCGHSLGGALACLYARSLAGGAAPPKLSLVTFGCPRVGDAAHAAAVDRLVPDHLRFVRDDDIVARVPTRSMGYRHAGTVLFFDRTGVLNAEPAGWVQFVNRAVLATEDLKSAIVKGVTDHSMADYLRLVRAAFDGEADSSPDES